MSVNVVFVVEHTERERGWGMRPDGYTLHPTEARAKAYIADQTAGRTGPAPDIYVSYEPRGYQECSPRILATVEAKGMMYVERLYELTQT